MSLSNGTSLPPQLHVPMRFFSVLVCSLFVSCSPGDAERVEGHRSDLRFLQDELEARHPDLYAVTERAEFTDALASVESGIAELSDVEIGVRLREAVALLGDPHTNATFTDELEAEGSLPFEFGVFAEGVFIIGAYPDQVDLLGHRVDAVGGRPIDEVYEQMRRFVARGRERFAEKRFPYFLRLVGIHHYLGAPRGEALTLALVDREGEAVDVVVPPRAEVDVNDLVYLSEELGHPTWINAGEEDTDLVFRDLTFDDGEVYMVQYNSCWGRELEERYGDPDEADTYPSFADFADRVVDRLRSGTAHTLVFDLRANSGGSSPQGTALIERIAALPEGHGPERIVVAISEQTFSSAVINAMDFKGMTDAVFVGSPTGGAPNHFGEVKVFSLPWSGQVVTHSSEYFEYAPGDDATTLEPDHPLPTRFADFIEGRDPVLDFVRAR